MVFPCSFIPFKFIYRFLNSLQRLGFSWLISDNLIARFRFFDPHYQYYHLLSGSIYLTMESYTKMSNLLL